MPDLDPLPILKPEPIKPPPVYVPVRPKGIKGKPFCPDCQAKGVRTVLRREVKWVAHKWVETGRFCPVCRRWFGGVADLKSPSPAVAVDRPVRPLLLNREAIIEKRAVEIAAILQKPIAIEPVKEMEP